MRVIQLGDEEAIFIRITLLETETGLNFLGNEAVKLELGDLS